MATFKYLIQYSKQTKKKPANIRIHFKLTNKFDCYAITGKKISPDFWNNETGSVRDVAGYGEKDYMIDYLADLKNFIEKAERNTRDKNEINSEWLKETINRFNHPEDYEEKKLTLFEFIEKYIKDSKTRLNQNTGRKITQSTLLKYGTCFNYLKDFAAKRKKGLNFEDINLDFYNDFIEYLSTRKKVTLLIDGTEKIEIGLATNTIGKQIAVLKSFMNTAIDEGHTTITTHKNKRFKILAEESDSIYLNDDELNILFELDLRENTRLDNVRDLFLVGSWTGCRFSDIKQISSEKIAGDYIKIKQIKTDNAVLIPLHPIVLSILKKHKNNLPRVLTNQKMNVYLKELGKMAGFNDAFYKTITRGGKKNTEIFMKWELLCTHTARRSFATNLYKAGFPSISIMQITGHRTEKAFLKYIKVTPEEHAAKLLEFWRLSGAFLKIAR